MGSAKAIPARVKTNTGWSLSRNIPDLKKESLSKQVRESHFLCLALTGALIGYLSSGIFLSVLYYRWFWIIMTYTVILFNLTNKTLEHPDKTG